MQFAQPIASTVIATVVSAWLVAKLKPYVRPEHGDNVTIERTVVELEEGQVARVLTEKITSETSARMRETTARGRLCRLRARLKFPRFSESSGSPAEARLPQLSHLFADVGI
ncbi:MAG: hypothetical protein M3082_14205 [Candidatus Dormibacteraeota bacterium]|nr:hypothetical protein [Candidatus Dormibacteraeota bacterium]